MPLHDVYARLTPYEIAFPGRAFVEEGFSAIAGGAERLGVDLTDPGAFIMLPESGEMIAAIMSDEVEPGASTQTGALVFHGFHFWRAREPTYLAREGTTRQIVRSASAPPSQHLSDSLDGGHPPWADAYAGAGYLQLPRNLVWSRAASDDGLPEPMDGFFWAGAPEGGLSLLLILGLRGNRAGFGAVHLPAVSSEEIRATLDEPGRDDGEDFDAAAMPGAEIDDLIGLETAIEAVKLAVHAILRLPGDGSPRSPGGRGEDEKGRPRSEGPVPSALPWRYLEDT